MTRLVNAELMEGAKRFTLAQLAPWTSAVDKALVF